MYARMTVYVSLGAVLLMCVLTACSLRVYGQRADPSIVYFHLWLGAPYLGYCRLAYARRRTGADSVVFFGTCLSAGLASVVYNADAVQGFRDQLGGLEVMNCAGPIVELGFPLLQWLFVGLLWLVTLNCGLDSPEDPRTRLAGEAPAPRKPDGREL